MNNKFGGSVFVGVLLATSSVFAQIKDVTAMEYLKQTTPKNVQVLDVRSDWEFKDGHLAGALNYDFNGENFKSQIEKLDRKGSYVLYCHGGGRSSEALKVMRKMGFQNITHIADGYAGLKRAGLKNE